MAIHIVNAFSNTCFENNQTITSVDLHNIPFVSNSMINAFYNCKNLQTVTNINQNVTNMDGAFFNCLNLVNVPVIPNSVTTMNYTFSSCTNLVNAPEIPNSVTNMMDTFANCISLVNAPAIPNSVISIAHAFNGCTSLKNTQHIANSVTTMFNTFRDCTNLVTAPIIPESVIDMGCTFAYCTNLTGNIYIYSNKVNNVWWRTTFGYKDIFEDGESSIKNVYIPFKYENGEYTQTYNTFINAGYSTTTRKHGALLFNITPPRKYVETAGYEFTNANDAVTLDKYTGSATTVIMPTLQEE